MCGINGIYGLTDVNAAKQKIAAMNTRMQHRGPDDEGSFVREKIALGHRRLSIIDLSAAGHQPMASFDNRYHIVYNGELYNYRELKFELQRVVSGSGQQSYFFQTNSDTEVILAAFARWGTDCLKRFNGMFAFAIWDNQKEELFIARDRLGIKPLYYFFTDGVLGFSSEIRSLLASACIPKKIDEEGLVDYLRYQTVHAPRTIIRGVKMLMPGHFLEMKAGKLTSKTYWSVTKNSNDASKGKSYKEVCSDVESLLTKAVERRLVADVPFGAFLSGGIDSSAIVGLMSKVATEKVRTFSVTFDESEFSEAKYAALVAKKFNTEHQEIKLTPDYFLTQLPQALKAMDHPSGDGPNTFIVSKATKEAGVTMALSGLGGDELFGGYSVFKRSLDLSGKNWLNIVPRPLRAAAGSMLVGIKPSVASQKIAELLKSEDVNFESFYSISRQVLMDKQVLELLNAQSLPEKSVLGILHQLEISEKQKVISRVSAAEISTYMQNVLLRDADQMSMASALEVRVPFIDYTLVEYVMGIKDEYKNVASPKKLLVDALGELLPPEVVNRPKMGFTFPWKTWMQQALKDFCEQKIKALSARKQFNHIAVLKIWDGFLKNSPLVPWSRVWHLVVLENWLQENEIE